MDGARLREEILKTLSGRYFVAPQVEIERLVETCNESAELTVQTAQVMAQKLASDELEPFVVVQVARVVNPQRGSEK
jgi:hypothetical protein